MGVTSVRLPEELQERLAETAERLRRSKGWVISEALSEYVEKEERATARLERTQKALAEAETSQVIDGDEVMDWIASWGTDQEREPPTR